MKPACGIERASLVPMMLLQALLLSLSFLSPSAARATINGQIEGFVLGEDDQYVLRGWACEVGNPASLSVTAYVNTSSTPSQTGTAVPLGNADYLGEDDAQTICQTSARAYRFEIAVSPTSLATYSGQRVSIYATSAQSGAQAALTNSGLVKVPPALSQRKRGCMTPNAILSGGSRSAYPTQWDQGQGSPWTYFAWVWRESVNGQNSSLSVARTQDFVHWQNTCGEALTYPLVSATPVVVDPVLSTDQLHNHVELAFDLNGEPVVSYQKLKKIYSRTAAPIVATQVFNARLEQGTWKVYQMTQWNVADIITGQSGSLRPSDIHINFSGVIRNGNRLAQWFQPAQADTNPVPAYGTWELSSQLGLLSPVTNPNSLITDPFLQVRTQPTSLPQPVARPPEFQGKFALFSLGNSFDERWPLLKLARPGSSDVSVLFNRYQSRFLGFTNGAKIGEVGVGPAPTASSNLKWPLIGNWGPSGAGSVGVRDNIAGIYQLNRDLVDGSTPTEIADPTPLGFTITDSPLIRSAVTPRNGTGIETETLPNQNDLGYTCAGDPSVGGIVSTAEQTCPEKFQSPLYVWKFNEATGIPDTTFVDTVWAGCSVPLAYLTVRDVEIVAYYDVNRMAKLAQRTAGGPWSYKVLDSQFGGWDGHNYLTLYVDENFDIHVSGNHHGSPLNYWRSNGLDIATLARQPMVGDPAESRTTYPRFYRTASGDLIFSYRTGMSGDGSWMYYRYQPSAKTWVAQFSAPLLGNW